MPSTPAQAAVRSATIRAVILVLVGSLGVQISSALAFGLFDTVGPIGTSSVRMIFAAIIVLVLFRPSLRGRTRQEWTGIILYGVSMAAGNLLLYLAIDRIPLGIATTLDFLGPCLVALALSRRFREVLLALLAFAGVALIAGLGGPLDTLGIVFAALAGASFALYTLLAAHIGKSDGVMQNMALSVTVAALITLPFSIPAIPRIEAVQWLPLLISAVLGTALAFTVDTLAGRLTSARVIGVLFAFDPMLGTVVGAVWLGQSLSLPALLGILLVIVAGAGIVWFAGQGKAGEASGHADRADPAEAPGTAASVHQNGAMSKDPAPEENGAIESLEVERKYEIPDDAALPAAAAFAELGLILGDPDPVQLEARYFDTPDGALAAQRFAVRMRVGGEDAGWHLKEKGDEGTRELQWPPSEQMPEGLRAELERRIGADRAASIGAIAILRTLRTATRISDAAGVELIELADD
ncbi:MAG: EamA family transporter, partial [Actinobacteria bacterium]|nr:EamA family transporter [Actinomycetota bacterium]